MFICMIVSYPCLLFFLWLKKTTILSSEFRRMLQNERSKKHIKKWRSSIILIGIKVMLQQKQSSRKSMQRIRSFPIRKKERNMTSSELILWGQEDFLQETISMQIWAVVDSEDLRIFFLSFRRRKKHLVLGLEVRVFHSISLISSAGDTRRLHLEISPENIRIHRLTTSIS